MLAGEGGTGGDEVGGCALEDEPAAVVAGAALDGDLPISIPRQPRNAKKRMADPGRADPTHSGNPENCLRGRTFIAQVVDFRLSSTSGIVLWLGSVSASPLVNSLPMAGLAPEVALVRALNAFATPLIRAGVGSPGLFGPGLVVVEIVGRRTGANRPTPLLGFALGDVVVVSTLRGDASQWVKNLAAQSEVRWWRWGREVRGHATVVAADAVGRAAPEAPAWVDELVALLEPWILTGWRFAVLVPGAMTSAR